MPHAYAMPRTHMLERSTARASRRPHAMSHPASTPGTWCLINTPVQIEPRAMRIACTAFLIAYASIAVARSGQSPGFFWLRFVVCLYAALGMWLARRVTWMSARAYTIGLALVLPMQAAYVDAMLGNHMAEVAISALATFCPLVFMQAGLDLLLVMPLMMGGHAAILAAAPS